MPAPLNVTVLPDGPFKISGDAPTVHFCGEALDVPAGKDLYLCRCGNSANVPFCDGTHRRQGFAGTSPERETKPLRVWEGRTIRTVFNPNACMHVFLCKPLAELRERELAGDDAAAAEIAAVVQTCPSGALRYEARDLPAPAVAPGPDIDIIEGGEVRLRTAFVIDVPLQEGQQGDRATLCRCGQSQNKPWCDGRHRKRTDFR